MIAPIQRACPTCESTVREGGCGGDWHEPTAYRLDLRSTQQVAAVRERYMADHPDYDPERHALAVRRIGPGVLDGEITGHADRDPQIEAIMARCCCHPDQPRGHDR